MQWRLYIDESGDHTYKRLSDIAFRYLGLTGVLIRKQGYDVCVRSALEQLKRTIFKYDPDDPPILVRSLIRGRKRWFYVLQDANLNARWEQGLLTFLSSLVGQAQIFTVVIDKAAHKTQYPTQTFDAYDYALVVLLNRIRGFLNLKKEHAEVMAESRGGVEDKQLQQAYNLLLTRGPSYVPYGTAAEYRAVYPNPELMIRKKNQNIAGLQVADVVAHGQKLLTIQENNRPMPGQIGRFDNLVNQTIQSMINPYGRNWLQ